MKSHIYVIYDTNDNVIGMYASKAWAERKVVNRTQWYRIVTYKIAEEDN